MLKGRSKNTKTGPAAYAPQLNAIDADRAEVGEALRSSLARFDELAKTESPTDAVGALLIAEAIQMQTATIQRQARHILGAIRDQTWVLREHGAHLSRYESVLTSIVENQRRILEKEAKR